MVNDFDEKLQIEGFSTTFHEIIDFDEKSQIEGCSPTFFEVVVKIKSRL